MDEKALEQLLREVQGGGISIGDAVKALKRIPYEGIGRVLFDHHRLLRKGLPEVIYGPGKDSGQLLSLARKFAIDKTPFIITRIKKEHADFIRQHVPGLDYDGLSRCLWYLAGRTEDKLMDRGVLIVTAGTSDLAVAMEASHVLMVTGVYSEILADVGVAGIHRLLDHLDALFNARVIIAVAGMEGALPSVIAGIAAAPVIAIPTSTGYGANLGGITPLLSMLNSCAPGVGVVNIDNGVGAALLAASIIKSCR